MLTSPMCPMLAPGDSPSGVSVPIWQWPRAIGSLQGTLWGHGVLDHGRRGREASLGGTRRDTVCSQISYQTRLVFLFTP